MCAFRCGWLIVGIGLALSPASVSDAFAAITGASPQPPPTIDVVPLENRALRNNPLSRGDLRRPIIIQSGEAAEHIRQGYIRAALCGGLGLLGLIFIGYRAYGRRQGRAAT